MKNLCKKILLGSIVFMLAVSFACAVNPVTLKDDKTKIAVNLYPTADDEDEGLLFYSNERFGYSVKIPKVFTKVVMLPDNGDGMILESKDGKSRFRVSGGFVMEKWTLKKTYDAACNSIGGTNNASCFYIGDDYWELCWWKDKILNRRKFLTNDEAWCDCEISYLTVNGEGSYDSLEEVMYRAIESLSFPLE